MDVKLGNKDISGELKAEMLIVVKALLYKKFVISAVNSKIKYTFPI